MPTKTTEGHAQRDEWDRPLGNLDGLARVRLDRTHLEAAVAEVRFTTNADLSEQHAISIWQGLGEDSFPVFVKHVQNVVNLTLGPQGASQVTEEQRGWLLADADRTTWITLLPSALVVQTSAYDRYSTSLGGPLRTVLSIFTRVTGASAIQRLGLRFINKLVDSDATSPQFWSSHIRADFAGPTAGKLGSLIRGQHQQVQLELDATAAALIQSGVFSELDAPDRFGFLIDLDVFREQSFTYEEEHCSNLVRQLNRTALALFAHVLSDEYLAELGPVRLDGEEAG
ncbi:MAG: hypothetical protein QOH97_4111 [Actinoplanes sp.]|jgi:uncharacterized protein (TIGR04255 family)|nr:hypothetical protein [Actinoplanes sp.]